MSIPKNQRFACVVAFVGCLLAATCELWAQGTISSTRTRPFVISQIPTVGAFSVGGIAVDTDGVLSRAEIDILGKLRKIRLSTLPKDLGSMGKQCDLRMISLRRLVQAINRHRKTGKPLSDEVRFLAGLQRIRYVFVYPDEKDIVLAGPAEGWTIDRSGNVVGRSTGRPVLRLDDLIVALRTAEVESVISCSIDPSKKGLQRLNHLLSRGGLRPSQTSLRTMEKLLGPQEVTLTSVPPTSHFARVMVAADFMMKRLAMGFEPAPVKGMPSYLDIVKKATGPVPRDMMPRWWMAPQYDSLLTDASGLAWELRGQGVQVLTENSLFSEQDGLVSSGRSNPHALKWAKTFTSKYNDVSKSIPVFGELRNCIDMAVITALLVKKDLLQTAGLDLSLLKNPKEIALGQFPVPRTIASKASFVKQSKGWLVAVSGGVELDSWTVLEKVAESRELSDFRIAAASKRPDMWWWDR